MNRFSRENMNRFFEPWSQLKDEIPPLHEAKNPAVQEKMEEALQLYYELLKYGEEIGEKHSLLFPLNGEERLAFIEEQMPRRYAFIQLNALFDESQKKAARLSVTYKE